MWHALFHTVSAFNNAGFALYPDGLTRYAVDPTVNLVVPLLFIVGGLGFVVIGDVWTHRRWAPLTLHSKLMLVGTAALILWGSGTSPRWNGTIPARWDSTYTGTSARSWPSSRVSRPGPPGSKP